MDVGAEEVDDTSYMGTYDRLRALRMIKNDYGVEYKYIGRYVRST